MGISVFMEALHTCFLITFTSFLGEWLRGALHHVRTLLIVVVDYSSPSLHYGDLYSASQQERFFSHCGNSGPTSTHLNKIPFYIRWPDDLEWEVPWETQNQFSSCKCCPMIQWQHFCHSLITAVFGHYSFKSILMT